jgi:cbb3-type cytochrome oxidase subunit 3
MFKFIKQYAESMDGISIYPVISLLIFFVFFIALLYYVKKMDKSKVDELSRIPLDSGNQLSDPINPNNLKEA